MTKTQAMNIDPVPVQLAYNTSTAGRIGAAIGAGVGDYALSPFVFMLAIGALHQEHEVIPALGYWTCVLARIAAMALFVKPRTWFTHFTAR